MAGGGLKGITVTSLRTVSVPTWCTDPQPNKCEVSYELVEKVPAIVLSTLGTIAIAIAISTVPFSIRYRTSTLSTPF